MLILLQVLQQVQEVLRIGLLQLFACQDVASAVIGAIHTIGA